MDELGRTVAGLMPGILSDLEAMVAIPSIAFPGYPEEPVHRMADTAVRLARDAGYRSAATQVVADGYPPVYAEVPGPPGSPVVILYAHYDVQPAPPEQGWTTDPWTPTRLPGGRIQGRGAADDKSGLAVHFGVMKAFGGSPPCTVRLVLEGMEETNSNLEAFVQAHPEMFGCDVFVAADMGNLQAGVPALTTTLRGDVACRVTVRTLAHPLHSGVFGGAAPDALMAMMRLLTTLQDEMGDVAVDGVTGRDRAWEGHQWDTASFRAGADLPEGVTVTGSGTVSSQLWARPSISTIGIDAPTVAGSSNALIHEVSAKISMRIVPGTDPDAELDALVRHLETHAPWGAAVEVERLRATPPFVCATQGPGVDAARAALREAFGSEPGLVGSGGTIPLLETLRSVSPEAEFLLWGAQDTARARIHASDESVDPAEIERMIVAEVVLLERLGASA